MVEEDLQHLKMELVEAQPSMVIQVEEGVILDEEEAEEEENR